MIERGAAVAVVGGGLAGLTAAYRLQQANFKITLFEADDWVGGRVQTVVRDGYLIDTGASALADSYESYLSLARELGLDDQIVPAMQIVGIYREGQLYELRLDQLWRSGFRTGLLSAGGNLRLLRIVWDIAWARQRGQLRYADMQCAISLDTESAGHYAFRVAGREVADYVASPIVRTMLIADAYRISKVELFSGVANIFSARVTALLGGQNRLPRLLGERSTLRLRHSVTQVHEVGRGVDVEFNDPSGGLRNKHFAACVISCLLPEAVRICEDHSALLASLNAALKYSQCITVAVGFHARPLCGKVVLSHITRWRLALPFTSVGSYRRIKDFNSAIDPNALIQFAGDYLSAAGQNSAVESGNRAAANLCSLLRNDAPSPVTGAARPGG